jgi:hypothetical protein
LEVAGAELPIPLESRVIVIGRRPTCGIPLLESSVSTAHAVLFTWEGKRFIRDLWTRTGTFVNGHSVHEQELKAGDLIHCGETDITYAPSLEEAAFSVVEGASDSVVAASPKADEVDLGLEIEPADSVAGAKAPLEVILPPKTPPRQEELLPLEPLEPLEPQLIESESSDTAHIPLNLDIKPEEPAAPQVAKTSDADLPRRGWRSAVQEEDAKTQAAPEAPTPAKPIEEPVVLEPAAVAPVEEVAAPPAPEIIAATEPTPESALDLEDAEESTATSPEEANAADLTDTTFGRSVEEFEGASLGPIIETPESPEPAATEAAPAPIVSAAPQIESQTITQEEPIDLAATIDSSAMPIEPEPLDAQIAPEPTFAAPEPVVSEPIVEQAVEATPEIPATIEDNLSAPSLDTLPSEAEPEITSAVTIDSSLIEPPIAPVEHEPAPTAEIAHEVPPALEETLTSSGLDALASQPEIPQVATIAALPIEPVSEQPPVVDADTLTSSGLDALASQSEIPAAVTSDAPSDEPAPVVIEPVIAAEPVMEVAAEPVAPVSSSDFGLTPEAPEEIPFHADLDLEPAIVMALPHEPVLAQPIPETKFDDLSTSTAVMEPPLDLDAEDLPAPLSTDDAAMMVLSAEQPQPTVEEHLAEPLPIPEEPVAIAPDVTVSNDAVETAATIDHSVVEAIEPISAPPVPAEVHSDSAVPEPELHPLAADIEAPDVEPIAAVESDSTIPVDQIEPALSQQPVETPVIVSSPVNEPLFENHNEAPDFQQTLDLSNLHPSETAPAPLDESSALDLLNNDSAETPAQVTTESPVSAPIDLSRLSQAEIPAPAETVAVDAPLMGLAQPTAQPVDDLSPGVAEDPIDLSFLHNASTPLDEHTAVDLLAVEPAVPESTILSSEAPEVQHVVLDHSILETLATEETDIKPPPLVAEPSPAISVSPGEFPDILAPVLDDATVPEPLITETSTPAPPPPVADAEVHVQAPAGVAPRQRKKSRVIRNAFGQDPNAPKPGAVVIPPFAGTTSDSGETITMAGLSMPMVREADVFSEVSQPDAAEPADPLSGPAIPERDVFADEVAKSLPKHSLTGMSDEIGDATASPLLGQPKRFRNRSARPGVPPVAGARPAVLVGDEEAFAVASQQPRKLMRRVLVMMALMLGLIGATWAGVYQFWPVSTRLQAQITFKQFDKLTRSDALLKQSEQDDRLRDEGTRSLAVHKLHDLQPSLATGFLSGPIEYNRAIAAIWPGEPGNGQMLLTCETTDPQNDKVRLLSVASAMYEANSDLVQQAHDSNDRYQALFNNRQADEAKIVDLSNRAQQERSLVDGMPSAADVAMLTAADKDSFGKRTDAEQKLKAAQADLDNLKAQQAAAATQPVDPTATDAQFQQMTRDAQALTASLTEARKGRADMADQARATLDAAYDDFKKELDSAQGAAKDNPALASYFTSAQNLQQAIRDITDQYIQHQQADYTALNELKNNFVAKMTDRKATLLANDPKLKEMSQQKEIKTRQYNEAVNSGLDKEAQDLSAALKQLDLLIKTQEELVANDPVYNDFITGLQQMIDQKQRSINDERQKTDQKLAELRRQFNQSAAGVQNLPAEQKELATTMRDKLAAIDAARKQYAEASDAAAADADSNIKKMSDDLQALQTNIEARKKLLAANNSPEHLAAAESDRQAQLAAKVKVVDDLTKALATAKADYTANHDKLMAATDATDRGSMARKRLDAISLDQERITKELDQYKGALPQAAEKAKLAIEPVEPTADDVKALDNPVDNRFAIAGFGSLGIFVLFAIAIIFTILSAVRASQQTFTPAFESLETTAVPKMDEEEAVVA